MTVNPHNAGLGLWKSENSGEKSIDATISKKKQARDSEDEEEGDGGRDGGDKDATVQPSAKRQHLQEEDE